MGLSHHQPFINSKSVSLGKGDLVENEERQSGAVECRSYISYHMFLGFTLPAGALTIINGYIIRI
jgi:hypothetical protein